MIQSSKPKRFVWILSLTLGPAAYCVLLVILLLTQPGTPGIVAVKDNFVDLMGGLAAFWAAGFVFVWVGYWSGKFMIKYGPFM